MKKVLKRRNRKSSTKFSRSLCNNSYERQGLNYERVGLRVLVALFSQLQLRKRVNTQLFLRVNLKARRKFVRENASDSGNNTNASGCTSDP